jgi:hypothetical protein
VGIIKKLIVLELVKSRFLTLSLLLLFMQSCTWNHIDDFPCDPGTVTWNATIVPILERTCNDARNGDCHSAAYSNGDFTLYAEVKSRINNGKFQNRVFALKNMPPKYSDGPAALSVCELQKIEKWIAEGALEN